MPSASAAVLTITSAAHGCLPGRLACPCGSSALCIWHPTLGARCSGCGRCYVTASGAPLKEPGAYLMIEGPNVEALDDSETTRPTLARRFDA